MPRWSTLIGIVVVIFACRVTAIKAGSELPGHHLYVNPRTGDDSADGTTATVVEGHAPFRTIASAIRVAQPGDTVHLAQAVYLEPIGIYGPKTGLPGKPITVDGHDAVLSGSVPLDPADWKDVGPGLYRNETIFTTILHSYEEWVDRFSFIIDGKLIRMNHSVKAPTVPWKLPLDLKPGEWTYLKDDAHAFVIKIDPTMRLADYRIEVPVLVSGVQFHGTIGHFIIKNVTVTHFINDGFALATDSKPGSKVRDILFQNCRAIDVCDDGLSAHGDCEVRVDGLVCDGCSTGIASQGTSINDRVVTRNIHGVDLLFGQGIHVVRNSRIEARGRTAAVMVDVWSKEPGQDRCTVNLENVLITGQGGTEGTPEQVIVNTANAFLEVDHTTINGLSLIIKNGGAMKLQDSIVGGGSRLKMEVISDSHWQAARNLFDLGLIRVNGVDYLEKDLMALQQATGQNLESEWKELSTDELHSGNITLIGNQRVGADTDRIPVPIPR